MGADSWEGCPSFVIWWERMKIKIGFRITSQKMLYNLVVRSNACLQWSYQPWQLNNPSLWEDWCMSAQITSILFWNAQLLFSLSEALFWPLCDPYHKAYSVTSCYCSCPAMLGHIVLRMSWLNELSTSLQQSGTCRADWNVLNHLENMLNKIIPPHSALWTR